MAEELCKKGASVTGLDSSEKSIKIAKKHAEENKLDINYIHGSILSLKDVQSYDCIVCFEMIEHMNHPSKIVDKIFDISKILSDEPANAAIIAPTIITDDIAFVTDIKGVCNDGVTLQTT